MELQKRDTSQLLSLFKNAASASIIRRTVSSIKLEDTVSAPLISSMEKQDKMLVHEFIIRSLNRLQAYYNLPDSKRYDLDTLEEVAYDFMDKHKHETIEDFALFFKMIRQGKIKALQYERFGFDTLQQAFTEYLTEHKIPQLEKKHKKHKQELDNIDKDQAGSYADVLKTIEARMKHERIGKQKKAEDKPVAGFNAEMEELKGSLPSMSINALRSARKAYMNASVRQHGDDGELHPAIKMIDDEINRRG